jgi:hypothetical protein
MVHLPVFANAGIFSGQNHQSLLLIFGGEVRVAL